MYKLQVQWNGDVRVTYKAVFLKQGSRVKVEGKGSGSWVAGKLQLKDKNKDLCPHYVCCVILCGYPYIYFEI